MLLLLAWGLFVCNSFAFFHAIGWVGLPWIESFSFAFLGTAVVIWFLLLFQYMRSLHWIKKMAEGLQVDAGLASFQKVKRKWSRMTIQLSFITILVAAYFGIETLYAIGIAEKPQSWITMGVWIVWMHSLIWFTLAWNRDQRLKHHLEREVAFEIKGENAE